MDLNMHPVDVISVCTASGELRPLRLRVEDESRQLVQVNIEEILSVKDISYVGAEAHIYRCKAVVWERKWIFELKYAIRSHTWYLIRNQSGA